MTQASTLSPISTSSPLGAWFTERTQKAQMRIIEMVNEEGYPLDDVREFVEEFGETPLLEGVYEEWETLSYTYNEDAIRGFIELNGINQLTEKDFIAAYVGQYKSGAEYAQEYHEQKGAVPGDLVIDWEGTWQSHLADEYEWVEPGYVFLRHW
jgi:hypothetical protein